MMNEQQQPTLERLEDTDLTLADPADDIRGRTVVDPGGEEIGKVDSLFIDHDERRVRLLQISSGGILGIGDSKQLIPVDSVTGVDEETVHVDQNREHVARGPVYDPDLARQDPRYFADVYGYYGAAPFWTPGYVYPRYRR
ncbi:PRC-barrel domain-containing protein [Kribbella deserti]|uniref:PRC-barrel domain-containing protein n=1 Tax=Kribbella deserti TaxID=1926257 RepID=A0ABV6QGH2_9ACTN